VKRDLAAFEFVSVIVGVSWRFIWELTLTDSE
jgi:hypothetical protein